MSLFDHNVAIERSFFYNISIEINVSNNIIYQFCKQYFSYNNGFWLPESSIVIAFVRESQINVEYGSLFSTFIPEKLLSLSITSFFGNK